MNSIIKDILKKNRKKVSLKKCKEIPRDDNTFLHFILDVES